MTTSRWSTRHDPPGSAVRVAGRDLWGELLYAPVRDGTTEETNLHEQEDLCDAIPWMADDASRPTDAETASRERKGPFAA